MKQSFLILVTLLALTIASLAVANTTGITSTQEVAVGNMARALDLSELRALSLQDRQTVKTWDTYARQVIAAIAGQSSIRDQEPLFTVLDITFRPEAYINRDILRIKNVPLRKDFSTMPGLDPAEAKRILEEGTVSARFWLAPATQEHLQHVQQDAMWKSEAIAQVQSGASALENLISTPNHFLPAAIVPPLSSTDGEWHSLFEVTGNVLAARPGYAGVVGSWPVKPPAAIQGYDNEKLAIANDAASLLLVKWRDGDAKGAQQQIDALVNLMPALAPAIYPSEAKRHTEVLYNKLYKLTLPGAALYFIAFTLFVVAAYSQGANIRRAGVAFMVLGFALHTVGIFIRWWLDQKSTGSWFYSIPIKNQFESVMMSAWFGIGAGLVLEVWKKKSLFGAAACFVGWMSLIALFTVPYVFGKDIGGEIGRVNGILMSYWLYIHVTLATASYALIGMSFLLGVWWLIRYFTASETVRSLRANQISADADVDERRTAFSLAPKLAMAGGASESTITHVAPRAGVITADPDVEPTRALLARLDASNVVILQLAFWILLIAIMCGAVWADVSWGRPWGWDPKETFALVTWIVYLIVIHVRLVTKDKAFWTAILTVIGFFVMLFNWIGVNYFLVGLHSYA
jgi:cytochrome c-type biogenesis protein CcsB